MEGLEQWRSGLPPLTKQPPQFRKLVLPWVLQWLPSQPLLTHKTGVGQWTVESSWCRHREVPWELSSYTGAKQSSALHVCVLLRVESTTSTALSGGYLEIRLLAFRLCVCVCVCTRVCKVYTWVRVCFRGYFRLVWFSSSTEWHLGLGAQPWEWKDQDQFLAVLLTTSLTGKAILPFWK